MKSTKNLNRIVANKRRCARYLILINTCKFTRAAAEIISSASISESTFNAIREAGQQ